MTLFFERFFDGLGHLQLSAAEFVGGMGAGEHSAGSEELVEGCVFAALVASPSRLMRTENRGTRSLYNKLFLDIGTGPLTLTQPTYNSNIPLAPKLLLP